MDEEDDISAVPSEAPTSEEADERPKKSDACEHCGALNPVMIGMTGPDGAAWFLCLLHWRDGIKPPGTQLTGVVEHAKPAGRDQPLKSASPPQKKPKRSEPSRVHSKRGQ